MSKFRNKEKARVIEKLNFYCSLLKEKPHEFFKNAYRPLKINLENEQISSLYTIRINKDIRVILTVDDDPIFEQTIITLLHVV